MVLDRHVLRAQGQGVAFDIASRIARDLGATVLTEASTGGGRHFDGLQVSDFHPLVAHSHWGGGVHAVHALGGALMAQWSYEPGPVVLSTPYADISLGAALPMLALARRLGCWQQAGVSSLESLMVLQSGAYSFGPAPSPDRWEESPRGQHPTYSLYKCRNGWVFLGALSLSLALKAFTALGIEERLEGDMLVGLFDKASPYRVRVAELLTETLGQLAVEAAIATLALAGVPASEAPDFETALRGELFEGFEQRGLVSVTPVSAPSGPAVSDRRPLRVLEVAGYISGPFVGRLLAGFGAVVTKVEPPDGDPLRRQGLSFAAWNHGKTCLPLHLGTTEGRRQLEVLIREADVVVTNYLPKTAAALGIDADTVLAVNPNAIVATVTGYPAWSEAALTAAFDPAIQATFGIMRLQGGADEPVKPQIAASDYVAAMLATGGILAALQHRNDHKWNGGYRVDTSLAAAGYLLARGARDLPGGPLAGGRDFRGGPGIPLVHPTLDGWVAVCDGPAGPVPDGLRDAAVTRSAAIQELKRLGYSAVPCNHPNDLLTSPEVQSTGMFQEIQDESGGAVLTPRIFGMSASSSETEALRK